MHTVGQEAGLPGRLSACVGKPAGGMCAGHVRVAVLRCVCGCAVRDLSVFLSAVEARGGTVARAWCC